MGYRYEHDINNRTRLSSYVKSRKKNWNNREI